jgi:hypothetical protein
MGGASAFEVSHQAVQLEWFDFDFRVLESYPTSLVDAAAVVLASELLALIGIECA